jgi:glutathione S-transferase
MTENFIPVYFSLTCFCLYFGEAFRTWFDLLLFCVMGQCVIGAFVAFLKEGEEKEKAIESALESFTFLEKQIQGKKFFSGDDNIGYLDLVMGWIPLWLNVMEEAGGMKLMDAQKFPFLHEWTQNFIEIPLIKECLPPRDALVNYFILGMSYIRSMAAAKQ